MTMAANSNTKMIIGVLIAVLVAVIAYGVLNAPDRRGPAEKVGDAITQLPNGVDNAARELESRTPAERIKDNVKDATDGSPR